MQLEIYTRTTCSRCDQLKTALKSKNISYSEHIIGETVDREQVVEKFPGVKMLPIVTLDGTWIGGRDEVIKMINLGELNDGDSME